MRLLKISLAGLGLLALCACGGQSSHLTPGKGLAPASPGARGAAGVFGVTMQPQPVVVPSFADKAAAFARLPELAPRSASFNLLELNKPADAFDPALSLNRVAAEGGKAVFSPDWDEEWDQEAPLPTGLAYCSYRFFIDDYPTSGRPQTVALDWDASDPPASFASVWLGLANRQTADWDWYAGPEDGVVTVDSLAPYTDTSGNLLLIVLMTGTAPATLDLLRIGDQELRGTGALPETSLPGGIPPLAPVDLPAAIDLSMECAAIGDQGTAASSTSFAVAGGAYNHELSRIYSGCGWDLSDGFNRVSEKYLYLQTGAAESLGCPDGRHTSAALDALAGGVATELNAPYSSLCDDAWSGDALADAALLQAAGSQRLPCGTADCLGSLKAVLANLGSPVVLRCDLDYAFFGYQPGQVWNFSGPALEGAGHALCIVGYDDAKQAFKARNSWSSDWGEDGHVWIGYATLAFPAANAACWYLWDEYDAAAAQRFCGVQAGLAPPTGLSASDATHTDRISLRWTPSAGADGYRVYRDSQENVIATLPGSGVDEWDDTGVPDLLSHVYWVQAYSAADESVLSAPDLGYLSSPLDLLDVQLDKTTHCSNASEKASQITVTTEPAGDNYVWSGPGQFIGGGGSIGWKPDGATPLGANELTCTVHRGTFSLEASVTVYVTDQPILTQYGNNGHFIDFDNRPSVRQPTAPFRPFSYYADGEHVVMFMLWGTWCPPARAQLPDMQAWATTFEGKFWAVGCNDFNGDDLQKAADYFTSFGMTKLESYSPFDTGLWANYGYEGYIPTSLLFDQDGNARLFAIGMLTGQTLDTWETTIEHLTGIVPEE